jgi:hypothetical protein
VLMSSPDLQERNRRTFARNHETYQRRWDGLADGEVPAHEDWDLAERCALSWDDDNDTG